MKKMEEIRWGVYAKKVGLSINGGVNGGWLVPIWEIYLKGD